MDPFSYQIGKLSGLFKAFEHINSKTNNGYIFEIILIPKEDNLESSVESWINRYHSDATITFSEIDDWKLELRKNLKEWLFCYQPHYDEHGRVIEGGDGSYYAYLDDVYGAFSLSHHFYKDDFINTIIGDLEAVMTVHRSLSIFVEARSYIIYSECVLSLAERDECLWIRFGSYD